MVYKYMLYVIKFENADKVEKIIDNKTQWRRSEFTMMEGRFLLFVENLDKKTITEIKKQTKYCEIWERKKING